MRDSESLRLSLVHNAREMGSSVMTSERQPKDCMDHRNIILRTSIMGGALIAPPTIHHVLAVKQSVGLAETAGMLERYACGQIRRKVK